MGLVKVAVFVENGVVELSVQSNRLWAALLKENSETWAKVQMAYKIEIQARSHVL